MNFMHNDRYVYGVDPDETAPFNLLFSHNILDT